MKTIAGIDPGLTGALAIIDGEGVVSVVDLPIHTVLGGKRVQRRLDLAQLRQMLMRQPIDHVVVEQVAARPGQGVTSMFNFGVTYGSILGLLAGLVIPYSLITPQTWQRIAGCGPSPDGARQTAGRLYPSAAVFLSKKRDAGRADAILVAHSHSREAAR